MEATEQLIAGEVPTSQLEMRFLHVDGRAVWVGVSVSVIRDVAGQPLYMVSQAEDITERKASGERLAHQAIHDPLTGLPNRLLFVDRLRRALAGIDTHHNGENVGPPPGRVAVLFLDLDHFKVVNDSLGHAAGDQLLVAVRGPAARRDPARRHRRPVRWRRVHRAVYRRPRRDDGAGARATVSRRPSAGRCSSRRARCS